VYGASAFGSSSLFLFHLQGMPFRTSHDVVGRAVAVAVKEKKELQDLTLDQFRALDPIFEDDVYGYLGVTNSVSKFISFGSTGAERVAEQLEYWKERLSQ
jgi:argininosuccinate lyase